MCMSRFELPRKAVAGDSVMLPEHTMKIVTSKDIGSALTRKVNVLKKQLSEEKNPAVMQRAIQDLLNDFEVRRYESAI